MSMLVVGDFWYVWTEYEVTAMSLAGTYPDHDLNDAARVLIYAGLTDIETADVLALAENLRPVSLKLFVAAQVPRRAHDPEHG